jgi:hypothetical protein
MNHPGAFFESKALPDLLPGIPQNLLDANVIYLYDSRLLEGFTSVDKVAPPLTRITRMGIDVVENPDSYSDRFSLSVQVLNIGTNYGQVAQTDRGATVTQTQTYSTFGNLRALVQSHVELTEEERRRISEVLTDLENTAKEDSLTKKIEQAREAFTKYGWLVEPLVMVLKTILHLS